MSALIIKIISCIAMFLDHYAYCNYFTLPHGIVITMRIIGRLAFPLYAFFIAEGLRHTKSIGKYIIRLLLFAIISELPYDIVFSGKLWDTESQNVFFTLAIALVNIAIIDRASRCINIKKWRIPLIILVGIISTFVFCGMSELIKCDYSYIGVLTVLVFYLFNKKGAWYKILLCIGFIFVTSLPALMILKERKQPDDWTMIQFFRLFDILFILLYNGKKEPDFLKADKYKSLRTIIQYSFYAFYPAHILLIGFL